MAITPLPAATLNITTPLAAPVALTAGPEASGVLTGATGFSFPNNGAVVLRVIIGAAGTGTLSWLLQAGRAPLGQLIGTALFTTSALANNGIFIFGPFQPSVYNDPSGLVQCTMTVYTGNSAGIYNLPGAVT